MKERLVGDGEQLELFAPAARAEPGAPELPADADPDGEVEYWSMYQSEFRMYRMADPGPASRTDA